MRDTTRPTAGAAVQPPVAKPKLAFVPFGSSIMTKTRYWGCDIGKTPVNDESKRLRA